MIYSNTSIHRRFYLKSLLPPVDAAIESSESKNFAETTRFSLTDSAPRRQAYENRGVLPRPGGGVNKSDYTTFLEYGKSPAKTPFLQMGRVEQVEHPGLVGHNHICNRTRLRLDLQPCFREIALFAVASKLEMPA